MCVQDSEYFNSMVWIKENDPSDLELHFSVEEDHFGEVRVHHVFSFFFLKGGGCRQ